MTVGERIKNRRLELGLSQAELAKKMGYADKTGVSKSETRGDNIQTTKVMRFADALECSFAYLMGWEDEKKSADIAADMVDDPQLTEYVGKILALDEKSRAQIYSLIDLLLGK